ncbi:MAG TPA: hypothetical protein VNE39_11105 [Planctomycetota bacterium]|nr:hypothetical protein [Planctomycetota bacterium]
MSGVPMLLVLGIGFSLAAGEPTPQMVRALDEFGPIASAAEAAKAFEKATEALQAAGGGVLVIPPNAPANWSYENTSQTLVREPAPPASTKRWHAGPGVTVLDLRGGSLTMAVPQMTGWKVVRTLNVPPGQSLPHWGYYPAMEIENNVVHGASSYLDWLQEPVKAGPDRRFYVPTTRTLFVGQFLNVHVGQGYGGGVSRVWVKSLGYDREKRMHYFVADTESDHERGAIVHNKNHTQPLVLTTNANASNQTFDLFVKRRHYAGGDTYLVATDFGYMGDVHSAAGDENGVCYATYIRSLTNIFRATVESADPEKGELVYAGAANAETIANSRPLINLNPKKWLTEGRVVIVSPASSHDPEAGGGNVFEGKAYPTTLVDGVQKGAKELRMGGLIRGTKECAWTDEVIGRFFAVDEPTELVKGSLRRWYEITSLTPNPDGTKDLRIRRYWWGAKSAGSPTLYDPENYTWDGHVRPLKYIIAPGTYPCDLSRGVTPGGPSAGTTGRRTLVLAPYSDRGTAFDFAKGDSIEQAIGPDPFKPLAFRAFIWDEVPGAFPSPVFDIANMGAVPRDEGIAFRGGPTTLEDCAKTRMRRPAWGSVVAIESAADVGLDCRADFADAAILFRQPNRPQTLAWRTHSGKKTTLGVSPKTGDLEVKGGGLDTGGGSIAQLGGLSATDRAARNLRGIGVKVAAGAASLTVAFPNAEADAAYAVFVEQSWLTSRAVAERTEKGFTVAFDKPAPEGATLDWLLVR